VKQFVTAYTNKHGKVPTKEQIDKHVNDDILLAKFASLADDFTQEIWDLVYDEGLQGLGGQDRKRIEMLCDAWDIPKSSTTIRERVNVEHEHELNIATRRLTKGLDQGQERIAYVQGTQKSTAS
jgi:hypothetical protein